MTARLPSHPRRDVTAYVTGDVRTRRPGNFMSLISLKIRVVFQRLRADVLFYLNWLEEKRLSETAHDTK